MPIFLDRHDIPGVSAKAVAETHQEDLKIQHKYNCKGLTYWFDEDKGMAFCLIEAPDKACVKKLHDDPHGLIPHKIIEVEPNVVESFLGRIEDPEKPENDDSSDYVIINDPALGVIMYIDMNETLKMKPDSDSLMEKNKTLQEIITNEINNYNGRKVKHLVDGYLISFVSVNQSVSCALAIQEALKKINKRSNQFFYPSG